MSAFDTTTAAQVAFDFWGAPVFEDIKGELYCPGFLGDTYATNPWDYLLIYGLSDIVANPLNALSGPVKTPGLATVEAPKTAAVDRKKAAGSNGETITVHGLNAGDVSIQLLIWTPQQLRALRDLWSQVFSPNGKLIPAVFEVSHPSLVESGIKALQFTGTRGWMPGPVPRSRVFTIQAVEFFPKSPSTKKVTQTAAAPKSSLYDPGATAAPPTPTPGQNTANFAP